MTGVTEGQLITPEEMAENGMAARLNAALIPLGYKLARTWTIADPVLARESRDVRDVPVRTPNRWVPAVALTTAGSVDENWPPLIGSIPAPGAGGVGARGDLDPARRPSRQQNSQWQRL